MNTIEGKVISVTGKFFRMARLRHEWCDFLENPAEAIREIRAHPPADVFTFVRDVCDAPMDFPFHQETVSIAVLPITSFKDWWNKIGFKARNKARKAGKCGVELRIVSLDDNFASGVKSIYDETPVKQGRKFFHYGQTAPQIKEELNAFLEHSVLVGAYFQNELIGFMKLFAGNNVLRTVHIIAKTSHRDKCVMDALIAKAVEICDEKKIPNLQYGTWTDGGIGDFRKKYGFQKFAIVRHFLPLTLRGKWMLGLHLHRPIRERVPKILLTPLLDLRARLNSIRYRPAKSVATH